MGVLLGTMRVVLVLHHYDKTLENFLKFKGGKS